MPQDLHAGYQTDAPDRGAGAAEGGQAATDPLPSLQDVDRSYQIVEDLRDIEVCEWFENAQRNSPKTDNEALRLLITITTALSAGSVAFLDAKTMPPIFKAIGCALMMASLFAALWGSQPYTAKENMTIPELHEARAKLTRDKTFWVYVSTGLFASSLVAFLAGVIAVACKS